MGSGKTTVGKALSKLLQKKFIDLDQWIEKKEGTTVSEIFDLYGETHFRSLEADAALTLGNMQNLVIAVGGGTVLNPENTKHLKANGVLIYLKVDPNTVLSRLKNDTSRPLLKENKEEAVLNLLEKRSPVYSAAADITVDGTGDINCVINEIINFENLY
jgi:shikimate kinase